MNQFLYWISGNAISDALLRECGLWARLDGNLNRVPSPGPGGETGVMLWHGSARPEDRSFDAENQMWLCEREWEQELPDGTEAARMLYVGIWNDAARRPNRESLKRKSVVMVDRCEACVLGAGTEHQEPWLVPILRMYDDRPTMPRYCIYERGEMREASLPEFDALDQIGQRIVAQQRGETNGEPITVGDLFHIAAEALALNYRIGRAELSLLRIPNDADIPALLAALTGQTEMITLSAIVESEKKIGQATTQAAILEALVARSRSMVSAHGGGVGAFDGPDGLGTVTEGVANGVE